MSKPAKARPRSYHEGMATAPNRGGYYIHSTFGAEPSSPRAGYYLHTNAPLTHINEESTSLEMPGAGHTKLDEHLVPRGKATGEPYVAHRHHTIHRVYEVRTLPVRPLSPDLESSKIFAKPLTRSVSDIKHKSHPEYLVHDKRIVSGSNWPNKSTSPRLSNLTRSDSAPASREKRDGTIAMNNRLITTNSLNRPSQKSNVMKVAPLKLNGVSNGYKSPLGSPRSPVGSQRSPLGSPRSPVVPNSSMDTWRSDTPRVMSGHFIWPSTHAPRTPTDSVSSKSMLNSSFASQLSNHVSMFESYRSLCLERGVLFEDPDFPPTDQSVFGQTKPITGPINWKRPKAMVPFPSFLPEGVTNFSVMPGKLGPNKLMGAFSCLTRAPSLLKQCIPEGQGFGDHYCGIFRIRFWKFNQWIEITIDDRLPTVNGELLGLSSPDPSEMWAALFEKAYAKFYGSYEAIYGGRIDWALQDLTGGVSQAYNLQENARLSQIVLDNAMTRASLVGASITINDNKKTIQRNGLITGHVYNVTAYAEVAVGEESLILLRLRDCWGRAKWNGAWSHGSDHWDTLSEDIRKTFQQQKMEAGEFWMSFVDFVRNFNLLEVCYLAPETWHVDPKIRSRESWRSVEAMRRWRMGYNCGGGIESPLLAHNCQFYLELNKPGCVIVSLLQKYGTTTHKLLPTSLLVLKAPKPLKSRLNLAQIQTLEHMTSSGFHHKRENVLFLWLKKGGYLIIPATQSSEMEGKFLLRVLTEGSSYVRELDEIDAPFPIFQSKTLDLSTFIGMRKKYLFCNNKDGEINAYGLQSLLDYKHQDTASNLLCCQAVKEGFQLQPVQLSIDTCKSAIAIFDHEVNGKLNFGEFQRLINLLIHWQDVFSRMSKGENSVSSYHLRDAIKQAGFTVSNRTLEALVIKFVRRDTISLESFINAMVKLNIAHQRLTNVETEDMSEKSKSRLLQELLRTAIYS